MRKIRALLTAALALMVTAAPAAAMTVEQAIAKHIEAKGGAERWRAIRTMKLTGTFTSFSQISPFTLHRKRNNRYHMDHMLGDKPVVIGFDDQTAWWDNRWFQEGAQAIGGVDLDAQKREFDFATALFNADRPGYSAKWLGPADLEGMPTNGIELTRPDGTVETWYLDPQTWLEVGRDSPGSDFGQPRPQRTFFDDHRRVDGVMIPHLIETQWYTRHRVMRVDRIETNLPVDDALFRMPAPTGMGPLLEMAGEWDVATQTRQSPDQPWTDGERRSAIESEMGGALLQERFRTAEGNEVLRTLSYDRFRKRYRVTQINDATGLLDVYEGDFGDDGRLVVSNLETDTPTEMFGMVIHGRITVSKMTSSGFTLEQEVSIDGGETWFVAARASYTRRSDGA